MRGFKDLSGARFGAVNVSSTHRPDQGGGTQWFVKCDCGKEWWTRQPDRLKKGCWECAHPTKSPEYHRAHNASKTREWRLKNPERYQARRLAWYAKNREEQARRVRDWSRANAQHIKDRRFTRRYGLSPDAYAALLEKQNGKCAICQRGFATIPHGAQVDHNHRSKQTRGMLCILCNTAIGKLNDDPVLIRQAAAYLEAFNSPT